MRTLYFLVPRTGLRSGGAIAQLKIFEIAQAWGAAKLATYEGREPETPFLNDLLATANRDNAIFVIHWGPDIPYLLQRLKGQNIVYVAHSTGLRCRIPPQVPIVAISKNTQAYWGRHAPNSLLYWLPNVISDSFANRGGDRDIDVLVQKRKSSRYLLENLVPALQPHCSVAVLDGWVNDLASEFNRAKVYLYDSSEYWLKAGETEGFGLPPLEALACGCTVFASVNDALSDYLDPGFNSYKLRVYAVQYDVQRILHSVRTWQAPPAECDPAAAYRRTAVEQRARTIFADLEAFFDFQRHHPADIPEIRVGWSVLRSRLKRALPGPTRRWLKLLLRGDRP